MATFSTLGERENPNIDFLFSVVEGNNGLIVPDGVHRVNDIVSITMTRYGSTLGATFLGYHISSNGQFYPIFQAPPDYEDGGNFQFIATNEPRPQELASYEVNDNEIVTNAPLKLGNVATFSNYGFRQEADLDGAFTLQGDGLNDGLNIQHGVHRVGSMLTIQPFGGVGAGPAVEVTFRGHVVSSDGTNYPVFEAADFDGKGPARFIGTDETGSGSYSYSSNDLVTNTPYKLGDVATFSNYGFRQGDLTGDFTLQGDGPSDGLDIQHGIHEVDGTTLTIQPFGGVAAGPAVEVTYVGHVVSSDGTIYPIFEAADFGGNGRAQFIGTDETGSGSYTPGALVTDEPYVLGFIRFSTIGGRGEGNPGDFSLNPISADIEFNTHMVNDIVRVRIDNGGTIQNVDMTFVGFEADTNYPILSDGAGTEYILTNEPRPSPGQTSSYTVGNIITDTPYTPCFAPGTLIATPAGERAVETLKPGDEVLTADGDVVPVKWLGFQKVSILFGPREITHPVRILAGALDRNVPHTDLVVTKDHGMILDGVICNAGALINGTSIVEVPSRELDTDPHGVITWYHVETENHVPLLANGAVAESFVDNADRAMFANHAEFVDMYGADVPAMTEMETPRAMSMRQVPPRVRLHLARRAAIILAPSGFRRLWQELRD